jgi:hypothetical protein
MSSYIPNNRIKTAYTSGREYIKLSDRTEYIGFYHTTPQGAIFTERVFDATKSEELILVPAGYFDNGNNSTYFGIKQNLKFNKYVLPVYYIPKPTPAEYNVGILRRYVVQKRNELNNITEISPEQAKSINTTNRIGIDGNLYKLYTVEWTLRGNINDVERANAKVLATAEAEIPGIRSYFSDLLEFYK